MYKTQLRRFYFEESEGYMHDYRLPNKAKTFKQFIKKNNQVKQCACEIVTAMYREDQVNRKELQEEIRAKA